MNTDVQSLLIDVTSTLTALAGTEPPELAERQLDVTRARHPGARIDLLWERAAITGTFHYDALIRPVSGPGGTLAVSFARDTGLPWVARGARRWEDRTLLAVNATTLMVDDAFACIDFIWNEAPILRHLVDVCLIREELTRQPVELSDVEIQEAVNSYRRARGLHTAQATRAFFERTGLTHQRLEVLAAEEASVAKLRRRIIGDGGREYFETHRADFDAAFVAVAECDDDEVTQIESALRAGRSLSQVAVQQQAARFEADRASVTGPSPFRVLLRAEAGPVAAAAFRASVGQVSQVRVDALRTVFVETLARSTARLDRATLEEIDHRLFEQWLEDRRRSAHIQWKWGPVRATAAI